MSACRSSAGRLLHSKQPCDNLYVIRMCQSCIYQWMWMVNWWQRKVEEEFERSRRHLRQQAEIIKDKAYDVNKANDIIGKLQNENIALKDEVYGINRNENN